MGEQQWELSRLGGVCRWGRKLLMKHEETDAPTASPGLSNTEMSAVSKGLAMGMMSVDEAEAAPLPGDEATIDDAVESDAPVEEEEEEDLDLGQFRSGLKDMEGDVGHGVGGPVEVRQCHNSISSVNSCTPHDRLNFSCELSFDGNNNASA